MCWAEMCMCGLYWSKWSRNVDLTLRSAHFRLSISLFFSSLLQRSNVSQPCSVLAQTLFNVLGHFVLFSSWPQWTALSRSPWHLSTFDPWPCSRINQNRSMCWLWTPSLVLILSPRSQFFCPLQPFVYHYLYLPHAFLHLSLSFAFSLSISVPPVIFLY